SGSSSAPTDQPASPPDQSVSPPDLRRHGKGIDATRQKLALFAAQAFAVIAVVLAVAAIAVAALAGPAVVLAVAAGVVVALARLPQLRAARRYRWPLQKPVPELQRQPGATPAHGPEGAAGPTGSAEHSGPPQAGEPSSSADYVSLARLHD